MRQIGRKLYHLLGGMGLLSLYYVLGRERALWSYVALAGAVIVLDLVRLRFAPVNRFVFRRFGSFIRKSEEHRMTGMAPYVLGVGLTLLFYQTDVAAAAICFLACGDVAATTVGERYGRTRIIGGKSLEGTMAFVAAALAAGTLLRLAGLTLDRGPLVAGAFAAAAVELLPLPVNDNLTIPLASGGVMELIALAAGPS